MAMMETPAIAGGLIRSLAEVPEAIEIGAVAAVVGREELWDLEPRWRPPDRVDDSDPTGYVVATANGGRAGRSDNAKGS